MHCLTVRGVRGKNRLHKLLGVMFLLLASLQALWLVMRLSPGCVVGMGGYAAGPAGVAALLEERDPLQGMREQDADIVLRLELLRGIRDYPEAGRGLLRRIRKSAAHWQRQLLVAAPPADHADLDMAGVLLACAYPDRIAQRRRGGGNHFLLSSGRGARFAVAEPLAAADYLVCAHLDGQREARIFLAARIDYPQLLEYHGTLVSERTRVEWDARGQAVQARCQQCLGK